MGLRRFAKRLGGAQEPEPPYHSPGALLSTDAVRWAPRRPYDADPDEDGPAAQYDDEGDAAAGEAPDDGEEDTGN